MTADQCHLRLPASIHGMPDVREEKAAPQPLAFHPGDPRLRWQRHDFRTIVKRLSSASARPTEIPQVRAATAIPTTFPQTKRYSPAHGGTPAKVAP